MGHNCPFIEKEHNKFITIPFHANLTSEEIDFIVKHIKKKSS